MRLMGLDYGDKTIGVAVSDELGWTAQGLEVIRRTKEERDIARLKELIAAYGVGEIVVGLPKNMNNTIGPRGEICIAFAQTLHEILQMPIHMWDERLTTASARRTLLEADVSRRKRKLVIDKMAAGLILQGYMDAHSKNEEVMAMSQKDQTDQDQLLEEPEIIFIPDDEGNEEEFEVIMKFEVDGSDKKYMMVVPVDADEESDEVYAFRYEEDGDDLQLYTIEDEEEWNIVEETFNTLMDEMEEEEEEEEEEEKSK